MTTPEHNSCPVDAPGRVATPSKESLNGSQEAHNDHQNQYPTSNENLQEYFAPETIDLCNDDQSIEEIDGPKKQEPARSPSGSTTIGTQASRSAMRSKNEDRPESFNGSDLMFHYQVVGNRIDVLCRVESGATERVPGQIIGFHFVQRAKKDDPMAYEWYHDVELDDGTLERFDLDLRWENGVVWIEGYPNYDEWIEGNRDNIINAVSHESEASKVVHRIESSSNKSQRIIDLQKKRPSYPVRSTLKKRTKTTLVVDKRGRELIGKRCQILFNMQGSDSKQWYWGTIADFDHKDGKFWYYRIDFDDNTSLWMELRKGGFRLYD